MFLYIKHHGQKISFHFILEITKQDFGSMGPGTRFFDGGGIISSEKAIDCLQAGKFSEGPREMKTEMRKRNAEPSYRSRARPILALGIIHLPFYSLVNMKKVNSQKYLIRIYYQSLITSLSHIVQASSIFLMSDI